ncbi:MAG: hypothetical protein DMG30_05930 [Acidobacteria bacterium]|nr:MAG: hypothetical protein DMG30_05930 [Acidobacteriota bacterium]
MEEQFGPGFDGGQSGPAGIVVLFLATSCFSSRWYRHLDKNAISRQACDPQKSRKPGKMIL